MSSSRKLLYSLIVTVVLFGASQLLAIFVLADDPDDQEPHYAQEEEIGPVTINGVPYTGDTGEITSIAIPPRLQKGQMSGADIGVAQQTSVFSVSPVQHAVAKGLNWLIANQHPDGGWGNSETAVRDTSEVVETLRYLEQRGQTYRYWPRGRTGDERFESSSFGEKAARNIRTGKNRPE